MVAMGVVHWPIFLGSASHTPTSTLNFRELRQETVRIVPVVPGKRPHRVPKARRSARFDRGIRAKYTRAASIEPLFGQFQREVRRIHLLRTPVYKGNRKGRSFWRLRPFDLRTAERSAVRFPYGLAFRGGSGEDP